MQCVPRGHGIRLVQVAVVVLDALNSRGWRSVLRAVIYPPITLRVGWNKVNAIIGVLQWAVGAAKHRAGGGRIHGGLCVEAVEGGFESGIALADIRVVEE